MSLYRCAACGSQNVMVDTQAGGVEYDYLKGAIGTVILGVGGAAAGIQSGTNQVYKCAECGITLSYSLPNELKLAVDLGVMDEKARGNLKLADGSSIQWETLKRRLKNIEKGPADEAIEQREQKRVQGLMSNATASKEEFDEAVDIVVDYLDKFTSWSSNRLHIGRPMNLAEYIKLQHAAAIVIENVAKFFPRERDIYEPDRYSLDAPFDKYRGLSFSWLKKLFITTYLFEKMELDNGIVLEFFDFGRRLADFAKHNPFIDYFMEYCTGENPPNNKHIVFLMGSKGMFCDDVCFNDCVFTTIPKYIVKNNRVGYNCLSCVNSREKAEVLKEDYFSVFPEKRQVYEEKLVEIKLKNELSFKLESEAEELESSIEERNKTIEDIENEVNTLKSKILGKKKALARAAELEEEIQNIRNKIDEETLKKKDLEEQYNAMPSGSDLCAEILKEMDYFVVWRWVEEE